MVDILVAFDKASIEQHTKELTETGVAIYDSSVIGKIETENCLDVSFAKLAVEQGGDRIMANTVAIGAILGMLGMKLDIMDEIIKETFRKKGDEVIKGNINAAIAGRD